MSVTRRARSHNVEGLESQVETFGLTAAGPHCGFLSKNETCWQLELGKDILTDTSFSPPSALPALQVPPLPLKDSQELTASLLSAGSQVSRRPSAHSEAPCLFLDKELP